ncbi:component of IIS longevity pathway SMK-1-domain-containing protein [Lipomyces arxii]|uniref:component of IIS longevity pathway SMK-1-domain-containing protein n=1 Tax=Lipomyces arxii TaxID=56418 RepID=UPI0034CF2AC2
MALEDPVTPRRVKVYELQQENWKDRGTGFCTGEIINDDAYIFVRSEDESEKYLLEAKVYKEVQYQKQQETLIVWTDPDETDLALSFQESEGCAAIWDFLTEVQKHFGIDDNQSEDAIDSSSGAILLPANPTLGSLAEIERSLTIASHTQYGRDASTKEIQDLDYIAKLIPLLSMAEDLESLADLHALCRIMKLIILMNDNTILEQIVLDDYIVGVVGILEYDPEFPSHKANHREYISDKSRFKEVVPIPDDVIRNKIKYTFRLQYLKDVVLARLLDDPTFSMLSSMIYFYQVDIVNYLQQNDDFTSALFGIFNPLKLDSDSEGYQLALEKRRDAIRFIHQFCLTAKNLQLQQRSILYAEFIKKGLFDVIDFALEDDVPAARIAGTEIILSIIDHDPSLLRSAVLKNSVGCNTVIDTLIELFLTEANFGVTSQVSEAIQIILDPTSGQSFEAIRKSVDPLGRPRADDPEIEMFLDTFYSHSARRLFEPLSKLSDAGKVNSMSFHESTIYICLCDLVCSFIKLHGYRSRTFFFESNVLLNLSKLFGSKHKSLLLATLRCFRQCIGTNDEFYYRVLIKNKLFASIVDLTVEVRERNNLLNSACLEFFEFIRVGNIKTEYQRNMKTVVLHLVDVYPSQLEKLKLFEPIQALLVRYEQIHDQSALRETSPANGKAIGNLGRRWNGIRDWAADEEDYFNTSDDEEAIVEEPQLDTSETKDGSKAELEEIAENGSAELINETSTQSERESDKSTVNAEKLAADAEQPDPEIATEKKFEEQTSNGQSESEESIGANGLTPLQVLGEKRRREEAKQEEEDELVKIASKKKKLTGFETERKSSSPSPNSKAASIPVKKGFFSNAGKKIAISLGAKRFKERDENAK